MKHVESELLQCIYSLQLSLEVLLANFPVHKISFHYHIFQLLNATYFFSFDCNILGTYIY